MRFTACCILFFAFSASLQSRAREQAVPPPGAEGPLPALIEALRMSDDPQFQLDVLKGMADGLKGRRDIRMPAGWDALARKLKDSPNPDIRELSRSLSVTFGSKEALEDLRATALNPSIDENPRRAALQHENFEVGNKLFRFAPPVV